MYKAQSKEEGNDQEPIQSNTSPGHHMGSDKNTRKHHTQKSQKVNPFTAGDHKAARNRQDSITDMKHKLQKGSTKGVPPWNWCVEYTFLWHQPHPYFWYGSRQNNTHSTNLTKRENYRGKFSMRGSRKFCQRGPTQKEYFFSCRG